MAEIYIYGRKTGLKWYSLWSWVGHVMGLQTHMDVWVWVARVRVRVDLESPTGNPHPWPGYGGFFLIKLNTS